MHKRNLRRGFQLLLAAGICLGTLASTGAADGPKAKADDTPAWLASAPAVEVPEGQPVQTTEQAALEEAAARQSRAAVLLAGRDLTPEQKTALSQRMGKDAALLQKLEQGGLSRSDLLWLALPNAHADRLDRYDAWAEAHPEDSRETTIFQVNLNGDQEFYSLIRETAEPDGLDVLVNKHYTLPAAYAPELEALGKGYGSGSLRPEAAQAFRAMADGARADGISLRSVSAYRSYQAQKSTYNRYLRQYRQAVVDTFSARPGHSEHQTGLALDINVASTRAHFENTPAFAWLKEHCAEYGFILRYDQGKEDITGYRFEPWHYRYVGVETAKAVMEQGLCYEEYLALQPA